MSVARSLVELHLGATLVLLVLFVVVVACQRAAALLRPRPAVRPAGDAYPQEAGASVLEWTIDLRTPVDSGVALQRTS